jgi:hypothetical protein
VLKVSAVHPRQRALSRGEIGGHDCRVCEDLAETGQCEMLLDYGLALQACGCSCADAIEACGPAGCGGAESGPPEPEPEPEP